MGSYSAALLLVLVATTLIVPIQQEPQQWAAFGQALWIAFLISQMGIILLISPGLTASAISAEREKGTLELLYLTPISSLALVLGKYWGAIGQMVMVVVSGLPVVAIVFTYGGVSPIEIVNGYVLLLAAGMFFSAIGLFVSSRCARINAAVAWSYGAMLIMLLGIPAIFGALAVFTTTADLFWTVFITNPPLQLFALLSPGDITIGVWWHGVIGLLVLTCIVLWLSAWSIRAHRGARSLAPRRRSLQVARHLSRPPGVDTASPVDVLR